MASDAKMEIDESLYSRQLYVLGHDAMKRMSEVSVLISGMGGLGAEIAKNIVLAGVKAVTIHDQSDTCPRDLSSQFFLRESDIGKNRAECSLSELSELNSYVQIDASTGQLDEAFLSKFQIVVLTHDNLGTFDDQLRISDICHERGIRFVYAETSGAFGRTFCDFGDEFKVVDKDGEPPYQYHIRNIIKGKETEVILEDDVRHMFDSGDLVTFSEVQGMTEINESAPQEVTVTGPYSIKVGDTSSFGGYKNGGLVTYVKKPVHMNFKRMRDSNENPSFETMMFDERQLRQEHLAFSVLHQFIKRNNALPKPWSQSDAEQFLEIASSLNDSLSTPVESVDKNFLEKFAYTASGNLSPIQGIIGGIAAQEVIKAISGKFTPINQWFYYNAVECLPDGDITQLQEVSQPKGSRYDGQIAVFGDNFQQKLAKTKLFLVGAGAIGCEMIKNFAMMGIAVGSEGLLTVTDMDTIEKSNLNRQFLFRPGDVNKPKSMTAAAAAKKMNPAMNIVAHENRVGIETENIYDNDFFEDLTAVVNALDNVEARKYMDERCVFNRKPMFESGTLGAKCSFQVILPDVTQCYSDTKDPQEKSYPMCTLKHFPVAIEHTLQWARDEFEGVFKQSIETSKRYLTEKDFTEKAMALEGCQSLEVLREVKAVLVDMAPKSFEDCIAWARRKFQENYNNQIHQLLHVFPPDHKTKTGAPFWSGPKRCPVPLGFSTENDTHLDYIVAAANLLAQVFGLPLNRDRKQIANIAANVKVEEFQPNLTINIPTSDEEAKEAAKKGLDGEGRKELERIIKALPEGMEVTLYPLDFEKDDDTNFHMDFITAASNLRAENYGIMPADRHKSKLIAGRIIPAIATTTSVVVGFICIELYKWIQGIRQRELFRNGFVSLATVMFCFTRPIAATKKQYGDKEFTIWDHFEIKTEITVQQLIDYFQKQHNLNVDLVNYGNSVLYSPVLTKNPQERLAMLVSKAVEQVTKKPIPSQTKSIKINIGCYDENDEELEVPYIKYSLAC